MEEEYLQAEYSGSGFCLEQEEEKKKKESCTMILAS